MEKCRREIDASRRCGLWGAVGFLGAYVLLFAGLAGCDKDNGPKVPEPGPLQAGVAVRRIHVPVGIGTVGFRGFGVNGPESPYSSLYPSTTRVHGHPQFRALVISRGAPHEIIFLRSDTVGVFQQLREAVAQELEARLGRSVDDAFIWAGTHTHSGPGRVIDGGPIFDLIADRFFPESYERIVSSAADTVMAAYEDLAPARVGYVMASCADAHSDRRCEDGRDYTNDTMPILAVERDGQTYALLLAYAIHGTILGMEDFTLSRDAAGGIETFVEAGFDHPVTAIFFNSWAADVAPGHPDVEHQLGSTGLDGYEQMDEVGRSVADAVQDAMPQVKWQEDPAVFAEVHHVPLSREAIGYAEDEFPYEWGALYCQVADAEDCDPATTIDDLDQHCIPFLEDYPAPAQTEISAGRVGDLSIVTFPGEPGTLLAEELLGRLTASHGAEDVLFLGYAQDYTGYSILEDDWWQGGYEAAGAMWGPRQGAYLVDRVEDAFARTVENGPRGPRAEDELDPLPPFDVSEYTPWVPTPELEAGTVVRDASPVLGVEDVLVVTVAGADPWLGTPRATLVDETGEPVPDLGGHVLDSDGYAFWVDLLYDPLYEDEPDATSRHFLWTFSMQVQPTVPGYVPDLTGGTYRLQILLPTSGGDQTVESALFQVE